MGFSVIFQYKNDVGENGYNVQCLLQLMVSCCASMHVICHFRTVRCVNESGLKKENIKQLILQTRKIENEQILCPKNKT